MATALITGATSGIGLELAKKFSKEGIDLILVARDIKKAVKVEEEIKKSSDIEIHTIIKDLASRNAGMLVYDEVKDLGVKVDYLVNNAGFGTHGKITETDIDKESDMLRVNISTLTELTKLFSQDMVKDGSGKIMNVASTAAFLPGPMMSVYYATKAYVLSFSEAISQELKGTGVTVTTLCPGVTKSGFQAEANLDGTRFLTQSKMATSEEVAIYGYDSMMKGKVVAIHGFSNKLTTLLPRFLPRSVVRSLVMRISQKEA